MEKPRSLGRAAYRKRMKRRARQRFRRRVFAGFSVLVILFIVIIKVGASSGENDPLSYIPCIGSPAAYLQAVSVTAAQKESTKRCIVVDAGHGGKDSGAIGNGDQYEKDINLEIALKVEEKLKEKGYTVVMTRRTDEFISLGDRANLSNSIQADLFIAIHQNSLENDTVTSGVETWYLPKDAYSEGLATCVQEAVAEATGARSIGIKSEVSMFVNRETTAPSVLLETGFVTTPSELEKLISDEYQDKIAEGVVDGIEKFFMSHELPPSKYTGNA